MNTKAACEILIRRWLEALCALIKKYDLVIDVKLVISDQNKGNILTRVPQRWLDSLRKETESIPQMCNTAVHELDSRQIMENSLAQQSSWCDAHYVLCKIDCHFHI